MNREFVFGMLFVALSAPYAHAQAQQKLTAKDCAQVFPWANSCIENQMHQNRLIAQAWYQGHEYGEEEFLGYVFLATLPVGEDQVHLLVGINPDSTISKLRIRGADAIDIEFLRQFEGRRAGAELEIACTLEDLLFVPAKIRAMKGRQEISESIVREVKTILSLAGDLLARAPRL
jgi:hypothetical protein